jgi:lactobin A/cerein 7B family class IIb bacteriocin
MQYLNNEELKDINGGGFHFSIIIGIGIAIAFIIGLLDGISRPLSCNK